MPRKTIPRDRLPALQKSYDQLCAWLNYDASTRHFVRHLLDSSYVKPFFREYRRDFLEVFHGDAAAGVPCAELYNWCASTNAFAQPKYADSKIPSNKRDWTALE